MSIFESIVFNKFLYWRNSRQCHIFQNVISMVVVVIVRKFKVIINIKNSESWSQNTLNFLSITTTTIDMTFWRPEKCDIVWNFFIIKTYWRQYFQRRTYITVFLSISFFISRCIIIKLGELFMLNQFFYSKLQ